MIDARISSSRPKRASSGRPKLTVKEVGGELGMSVSDVERLIRSKELPAKRSGDGWKIPRPGVERLLRPPRPSS